MNEETIVAVFDTASHAAAAVKDLEAGGIPSSAITQHGGTGAGGATAITAQEPHREQGFWASLFGGEPETTHDSSVNDSSVYDRSMQSGSTVVTVRSTGEHLDRALDILERHNPIDIDERAASYGNTQTTGMASAAGLTGAGLTGTAATGLTGKAGVATDPATIRLSEETLAVGKRAVNRGTTRVRRYVVETPVEETVSLRNETVSIERRPVTDGRAVTGADFSDKVIELTETAEEAVIAKTARVREEVVIRKDVTDRTETVKDTVRREDVEITKEPGTASFAETGTATTTKVAGTSPYKPTI